MNYRQAENYILSFTDYEKIPGIAYTAANYDLRRMEKLLKPLGDPHLGTKTVHIAGTKGKGSTAAMISQILVSAGYRTGLFTSPHLNTIRERMRINGAMISDAEFAALVSDIRPIVESVNKKATFGELTTFEILTAIVFTYFKRAGVDYQVLEVGLGGRLDATNVVKPDVCVITSLSLDHTEILGDTVAKLAAEKAGIIKPGCIVVNAPQSPDADRVIKAACQQQQAKLVQVGRDVTWRKVSGDLSQQRLRVKGKNGNYDLTVPLLGDYQLENAATALAAIEALQSLGTKISPRTISKGFQQVRWPGRFQILSHNPMVVVDGAHNAYSMKKLVENVKKYFHYDRCFLVFGTSCDKDISGMARELETLSHQVIITSSSHPRAASVKSLTEKFSQLGIKPVVVKNVAQALSSAQRAACKTDMILITGSLFVAGEAISYFDKGSKGAS